ncbi:MAG TPA: flagellar motor switch protein FliN [Leptospiraceae bacterium]|nr:flagellar motor switch protein FliN [Leptospiraceae bacterium]HRG77362.1 flagellar motor switch protein FliN [Leptospiraceae bacterium]
MADGALSQEDIDALLGGGSFGGGESSSGGDSSDDPFAGMNLGGGDGPSSDAIAAALGPGFSQAPQTAKPTAGKMGGSMASSSSNLNLLMDVTMSLTVELGRTNMYIKDVLQLSEGAVVELDKNIGEELDLLANGKIIGRGKIIILDDYYGVQVTHIIDPMERLAMG